MKTEAAVRVMFVDKKSPIPAYFQLRNILLKKIESGEYAVGSLIPSERGLGESFGISRMTVRQALSRLVQEGVLYSEQGRGTFVSRSKLEQKNIMSFSEAVRQKGLEPGARVLRFASAEADAEVSEALGLASGDKVYVLKRLRLANLAPVGIEEDFLPARYFPGLEKLDLTSSLYRLIRETYSYTVSYVDNLVEASRPTKEEREMLKIAPGIPVLHVTGVNFTESGLRLFYERAVYRSDEYKCSMRVYINRNIE
jgi:GntR family transcriptional regulator